jgi:hypothetical protein
MAFKTTKNSGNFSEARAVIDLAGVNAEVTNVRQISDSCIVFTLRCKGFAFYSMRVVERKSDGEPFIAVPQDKGTDGKYYKRYAVYLSEADQKALIDKVFAIVNGTDETAK